MNEQFLSYLWKYRQINSDLKTESGYALTVLHPGDQNTDSGPDFFNARLRIGNTIWAGNAEIHVRASDWYKHGHQSDRAYDNTILHVVYESDISVCHQNGEPIQTLVLKNQYSESIFEQYQSMMQNHQWIPCYNQLRNTSENNFNLWVPALAVERLIHKSVSIKKLWESCGHDWEESFYRHFALSFGFRTNGLPFELLAKSIPLKIVRQLCDRLFQAEALFYGQAGMLSENFSDEYPRALLKEYHFLAAKYNLSPVHGCYWKFLRLRPANFPTLRISQFAGFLINKRASFFKMVESGTFSEVAESLNISASEYWNRHYLFDKTSHFQPKSIGPVCVNLLIINGLVPFLFFYGLEKDQPCLREKALNFLEQLPGERNSEIVKWESAGLPCGNAMQTQALLQLKWFYCDKKRCLECRIGSILLAPKKPE
ncbi:MAG: DUF2851 family protein [Bacteroidota bacterium]